MTSPRPLRRFRLVDAMVLTAAAAATMGIQRWTWEHVSRHWNGQLDPTDDWPAWVRWRNLANWYEVVAWPYIAVAASTLLILRLIPPRPSRRRLTSQAGATACVAVVVSASYRLLDVALDTWTNSFSHPNAPAEYHWETLHFYLVRWLDWAPWDAGLAVAALWLTLALGGRLRVEPSWIDRAGRLLGIYTLIVLATSLTT